MKNSSFKTQNDQERKKRLNELLTQYIKNCEKTKYK